METSVAFAMHFMAALEDRRESPRDDMLTRIVHSTVEGRVVRPVEALGLTLVTVIAGHETIVGGIGSMLMHVGSTPSALERLLADRSLVPRAVDETIRMEAPLAQIEMRIVLEEVLRRMPKLRLPDPSDVRFDGAQSRTVGTLSMEWT